MNAEILKKIVFLGMGGTIAGTASNPADNVGYRAGQLGVEQLLAAIPSLQKVLGDHAAEVVQVAQIDSKDMDFAHWESLAQHACHYLAMPDVAGLVITHGTDTLEETAFFLSQVLPTALMEVKPVVLTCAMRPASSLSPDGPQNLLDAVALARTVGSRGVLVVCAGAVHSARTVQKVHPYRLDAFDSGEAGPLGYMEEGSLRLLQEWPRPDVTWTGGVFDGSGRLVIWPRVEIVMNYVGARGDTVRALAKPQDAAIPLRGIVVACTGNGTIHHDLESALLEVQSQGVQVVRATRCAYGCIVQGPSGDEQQLSSGQRLSPVKARIALMLELMT